MLLASALLTLQVATASPLDAERADFARWLRTSPISPYAAIYHQPLEGDLRLGPDAAPPLDALPAATLRDGRRGLTLETVDGERPIPRHRAVLHARWRIRVGGTHGLSVVTIFQPPDQESLHGWFPYDSAVVVNGALEPPAQPEARRLLALDGLEAEATLAGTFTGALGGVPLRLTVYRIPEPGTDDAELQVFFRDATSGNGSYPAGRFLTLTPLGRAGYRADFNRARNPFCAYNTVFPCPLPWRGNTVAIPIAAGERYVPAAERAP